MAAIAGSSEELNPWLSKLLGFNVAEEGIVKRVLIDIDVNEVVKIYVERYLDSAILAEPIPQALLSAKFINSKETENVRPEIPEAVQQGAGSQEGQAEGD